MTRKKLYISGPMRGHPMNNFPAFFKASLRLRELGYDVLNPAEYDMAAGLDPHAELKNGTLESSLARDTRHVLEADGIVMIDGWRNSVGARYERAIAHYTGKEVFVMLSGDLVQAVALVPEIQFDLVTNEGFLKVTEVDTTPKKAAPKKVKTPRRALTREEVENFVETKKALDEAADERVRPDRRQDYNVMRFTDEGHYLRGDGSHSICGIGDRVRARRQRTTGTIADRKKVSQKEVA